MREDQTLRFGMTDIDGRVALAGGSRPASSRASFSSIASRIHRLRLAVLSVVGRGIRSLSASGTRTVRILVRVDVMLAMAVNVTRITLMIKMLWLASALSATAAVETMGGIVTHVRDGDTIELNGSDAIRLWGVSCPELRDHPLGEAARLMLVMTVLGEPVVCSLTGDVSFDRKVGGCSVNGQDLGRMLIQAGLCGRCPAYDPDGRYVIDQTWAGPFQGKLPAYCRSTE